MSRITTIGINPNTGDNVDVSYGYDTVPGFKSGFFFQVYSNDVEDMRDDPSGEGIIVNEGFLEGISEEKLMELGREYSVEIRMDKLIQQQVDSKSSQGHYPS